MKSNPGLLTLLGIVAATSSGCVDRPTSAEATGTGSAETGGSDDGSDDEATDDETSGPSGSTGEQDDCGNGVVDPGEECDDGNSQSDDGCTNLCTATPGSVLWTRRHNGADDGPDAVTAIALTPSGQIVVGGSEWTEAGNEDSWLRAYSPDGDVEWTSRIDAGRGEEDGILDIAVSDAGSILTSGYVRSAGGDTDARVASHDAMGVAVWEHLVAGEAGGDDRGYAVGVSSERVFTLASERADDGVDYGLVLGLDLVGNEEWRLDARDSPTYFRYRELVVDSDGLFLVGVGADSPGAMSTARVTKLDSNGAVVWEASTADAGMPVNNAVAVAGDRLILAGSNGSDLAIAALRAEDGEVLWVSTWDAGIGELDVAAAVAAWEDGALVAGSTVVPGQQHDALYGFLREGGPEWMTVYDGPGSLNDAATGLTASPDGFLYVAGYEAVPGENSNAWVRKVSP